MLIHFLSKIDNFFSPVIAINNIAIASLLANIIIFMRNILPFSIVVENIEGLFSISYGPFVRAPSVGAIQRIVCEADLNGKANARGMLMM